MIGKYTSYNRKFALIGGVFNNNTGDKGRVLLLSIDGQPIVEYEDRLYHPRWVNELEPGHLPPELIVNKHFCIAGSHDLNLVFDINLPKPDLDLIITQRDELAQDIKGLWTLIKSL